MVRLLTPELEAAIDAGIRPDAPIDYMPSAEGLAVETAELERRIKGAGAELLEDLASPADELAAAARVCDAIAEHPELAALIARLTPKEEP